MEDNPGYGLVVHPPLAKQLIAVGEAIFGYNGWGWRFASAIAGTILVLLVVRITRRLTRSTMIGAIAGLLLIVDGLTFVSSRIGMLDIFMALFVTAAFGCLWSTATRCGVRMARVAVEGRIGATPFGPRHGVRWWRFGAGVCSAWPAARNGRACTSSRSSACCASPSTSRRGAPTGCERPWVGALRRDLAPALYALLLLPLLVYLATLRAVVRQRDRRRPARGR